MTTYTDSAVQDKIYEVLNHRYWNDKLSSIRPTDTVTVDISSDDFIDLYLSRQGDFIPLFRHAVLRILSQRLVGIDVNTAFSQLKIKLTSTEDMPMREINSKKEGETICFQKTPKAICIEKDCFLNQGGTVNDSFGKKAFGNPANIIITNIPEVNVSEDTIKIGKLWQQYFKEAHELTKMVYSKEDVNSDRFGMIRQTVLNQLVHLGIKYVKKDAKPTGSTPSTTKLPTSGADAPKDKLDLAASSTTSNLTNPSEHQQGKVTTYGEGSTGTQGDKPNTGDRAITDGIGGTKKNPNSDKQGNKVNFKKPEGQALPKNASLNLAIIKCKLLKLKGFGGDTKLNSRNQKPLDPNSDDDRSFGEIRSRC